MAKVQDVGPETKRVERSYEKKVDLFARAKSAAGACSDCLVLSELTRLREPKCLYGELSWPGKEDEPTIKKG